AAGWPRSGTWTSRSPPESAGRCSGRTAPARPRCSTSSPAATAPRPGGWSCSAATSLISTCGAGPGWGCPARFRPRGCSADCRWRTTCTWPRWGRPGGLFGCCGHGDVTLVLIEHDMDVAVTVADRVTMMHEGALITEGTPAEIRADQLVHDLYLGRSHG